MTVAFTAIDPLPSWRATPTKQAITDFVAAVTDESTSTFVPELDRVAVFDNDGTFGPSSRCMPS